MAVKIIGVGSLILSLVAGILLSGCVRSNVTTPSLPMEDGAKGCKVCHSKLSEQVPKGHPAIEVEEEGARSCLVCHESRDQASSWEWIIHFKHLSVAGLPGDCWSCHLIDRAGKFKAYDSNLVRMGVKYSKKEIIDRIGPYYRSWATSAYLDHKHALKKLTCEECHGVAFPTGYAPAKQCANCHGNYDKLAQKTSIHSRGFFEHFTDKEVECSECHKAHKESVLLCSKCHAFSQKVP